MQITMIIFTLVFFFGLAISKEKGDLLRKKRNPSREDSMTEHPIESKSVGVDFKGSAGIEFYKEHPKMKKKIVLTKSRDEEGPIEVPTELPYPSSSVINVYGKGSPLTAEDLQSVNPITFVPFKLKDEGAIGNVDISPAKNLINQDNNEKLLQNEKKYQDFYRSYFGNYYKSLTKLYNGSNTTGITDPKMKKMYKYAPLMYTLSYENNVLTNNKIKLEVVPPQIQKAPCQCENPIESCNCDSLIENEAADDNLEPFIPIWQPTIKHNDCQESVENCSCDDETCSPNDINCLSKTRCKCGCDRKQGNNTTNNSSNRSSNSTSSQNGTNTTNATNINPRNSTNGESKAGFNNFKVNTNNFNALNNANNLNKIDKLKTSSYETIHDIQHVNNYFYGQNFKEIS